MAHFTYKSWKVLKICKMGTLAQNLKYLTTSMQYTHTGTQFPPI